MAKAKRSKPRIKSTTPEAGRVTDGRARLLKEGREAFLTEGSRNLSIRKVAQAAEVNLGSFVYHFKTKDAFIEEIVYSHYDEFLGVLNKAVEESNSDDPLVTLKRILTTFAESAHRFQALAFRFLIDAVQGEEVVINAVVKKPPTHLLHVINLIKKCQAEGKIRKDQDPKSVILLLVSVVAVPTLIKNQILKNTSSKPFKQTIGPQVDVQAINKRLEVVFKGLAP